jgi:hypothetical protein
MPELISLSCATDASQRFISFLTNCRESKPFWLVESEAL